MQGILLMRFIVCVLVTILTAAIDMSFASPGKEILLNTCINPYKILLANEWRLVKYTLIFLITYVVKIIRQNILRGYGLIVQLVHGTMLRCPCYVLFHVKERLVPNSCAG